MPRRRVGRGRSSLSTPEERLTCPYTSSGTSTLLMWEGGGGRSSLSRESVACDLYDVRFFSCF